MAPERAYRPAYKNVFLISGLALVILGLGNWLVGAIRARPYEDYLLRNPGPEASSENLKNALLEPPDEAREERSISRAKLEFYELVRIGGRLMVVLGSLSLLAGLVRPERPGMLRGALSRERPAAGGASTLTRGGRGP